MGGETPRRCVSETFGRLQSQCGGLAYRFSKEVHDKELRVSGSGRFERFRMENMTFFMMFLDSACILSSSMPFQSLAPSSVV